MSNTLKVENKKVGVVIDSTPEEIEALKEKWTTINNIAKKGESIMNSGLILSLLSPLDFEGPIIEIVTAVGTVACHSLNKFSQYKLDKLTQQDADNKPKDDVWVR